MGLRDGRIWQDHGGRPGAGGRSGAAVAWLTLDDTDTAAGRLLTYLEAALGTEVAQARGVATQALAARLPHAEAAGLLAEATDGVPVLLVIDELERLADAREALAVIAALLRYAPGSMRVVLISRRELDLGLGSPRAPGASVAIADADLAFTTAGGGGRAGVGGTRRGGPEPRRSR